MQAAQKGPDARRRPQAAGEAYSLYVEPAAEGAALPQMGLFQPPAQGLEKETKNEPNSTGSKQAGISPCFHAPGILARWKPGSLAKRRRSSVSLKTRQ